MQQGLNIQKNIQKYDKDSLIYQSMSREQLLKSIAQLDYENRRLKNRLADHEPFKQKVLKLPNQQKMKRLFENSTLNKYALKVCYLGFNYDGMACNEQNDNSIEHFIFKALYCLSLTNKMVPAEGYTRAGRTDKGVSAMGNVISLPLRQNMNNNKTINYCQMINALLPQDIRIIAAKKVEPEFNARYWCTQRRYKYFFAKGNLNLPLLQQAIKQFEGTHNFINFCKMNVTNTVNFERTIQKAQIVKASDGQRVETEDNRNDIYYFYFIGNSFLWHQIRFMASVLLMIGSGKEPPSIIQDLFNIEKCPRKPNYPMAPDYPLILEDCYYQNLVFQPEQSIIESFYQTFNKMVLERSIEKVLIINCMMMAKREFINSAKITNQIFLQSILEKSKIQYQKKSIAMHKSAGRGLQEAINSLKGKKLQLYKKKAEKQAAYDKKIKEQKQQKQGNDQKINQQRPDSKDENIDQQQIQLNNQ